ncbi:uncharacterized protein LOC131930545 [Physella acuta]|uniref:uncharacterized protein LOC131930545 n=1 Tax=Physella acuta TaxID=109671 RepID=UPI0027DBFE6A|nr:uncharacterized protein LOC131930545 [Physella acuta]
MASLATSSWNNVSIVTLGLDITSSYVYLGLITERQYFYIECCSLLVVGMVSLFGGVSNVINIVTFLSMGIAESMTVFLLLLAFSDLAYLLVMFFNTVLYILYLVEKVSNYSTWFYFNPDGARTFCAHTSNVCNTMNILLTMHMAVVRCLAVIRPLHFRNVLSGKKTLPIVSVYLLFSLLTYIPILAFMGRDVTFDPKVNASRLVTWISPQREKVKNIIWLVRDAILPFAAQVIVIACVVVMTVALKASAHFRSANTTSASHAQATATSQVQPATASHVQTATASQNQTDNTEIKDNMRLLQRSSNLSRKDVHVIQQLVLVCLVFVVFNTPRVVFSLASLAEDKFSLGGVYHYLYLTGACLVFLFQVLNSSLHVFIYYKYSSTFRQHFMAKFIFQI